MHADITHQHFYAVENRRAKASVKKAYVYSKLFRTERAYTVRYSYESFVHVECVSIVVVAAAAAAVVSSRLLTSIY